MHNSFCSARKRPIAFLFKYCTQLKNCLETAAIPTLAYILDTMGEILSRETSSSVKGHALVLVFESGIQGFAVVVPGTHSLIGT